MLRATLLCATASALRLTRRSLLPAAVAVVPAAAQAKPPGMGESRTEGYAVQKTEAEWQQVLSAPEYFILRSGGTEPPNSSPLVKEKRAGEFRCAGCGASLFASAAKFDSGTGWPSFATQLPAVAVEMSALEFLAGAEIRCGRCGGHLGDRFLDGALFPGTPALLSGQRYCVDGSAVVFYPADGSAPVRGEWDPAKPRELPAWAKPPGIKVNG